MDQRTSVATSTGLSQNDVLQQREGRRLLFAFLALAPSICPPSELTMFAAGKKDGNVIVILLTCLFLVERAGRGNPLSFCLSPANGGG